MEDIPNNRLGCIKPCESWEELPTSTGAGYLPSTVLFGMHLHLVRQRIYRNTVSNSFAGAGLHMLLYIPEN